MWDSLSDLLLGDAEGSLPDVFQDEPSSIFQDTLVSKSLIDQPEASGSVVDAFPDWLDLKMDLSLLEGLECSDGVLNDFLLGDVTTGLSSDLQTHSEGKVLETSVDNELPQEYPFDDDFHLEKGNTQFILEDLLSPPYTPPSSPEGLVPDLGIPGSPVPSLVSISEPSSPVPVFITTPTFASAEPVFTFVAPILQPFQIGIIDLATVVSVESQALPVQSLALTRDEDDDEVSTVVEIEDDDEGSPAVEIVRVKKERKRKGSCAKDASSPKRRAKSSANSTGELAVPASKKERKRKQNKDAATRYRVKKRVECDVMLDEETGLMEENKQLKDKAHQLSNEITYLKGLMREMFKARGLM